jgi:hypothetical protein
VAHVVGGIDIVHIVKVSVIEDFFNESLDESPILFYGHVVDPPCLPTHVLAKAGNLSTTRA